MNFRVLPALLIAACVVSCKKPKDGSSPDDSRDSTGPRVTQSGRTRPEGPTGRSQKLRASLDAAMRIDSPDERDLAIAEVVKSALEIDPALSAEAFQQLTTDSALRADLLLECSYRLMARSPDEALAWADLMVSSTDIDAAKSAISSLLAETDPLRAMEIVSSSGISADDPNNPMTGVLQTWAATAPQDAASWALAVTSAESRELALKAVASQWLMADSQAAIAWLSSQNQPARRYEVTHALAESLVGIPEPIREEFLQSANAQVRGELEAQMEQITREAEQDAPVSEE